MKDYRKENSELEVEAEYVEENHFVIRINDEVKRFDKSQFLKVHNKIQNALMAECESFRKK